LLLATPTGHLADRLGAREVLIVVLLIECAASAGYLLLLLAGAVHVVGELLFVASSWGLSIALMPPNAPGQYQGMFATGEAAALMAAPALITLLVVTWGQPGWLVLATIFLLATASAIPVTRWAVRTRPSVPVMAVQ